MNPIRSSKLDRSPEVEHAWIEKERLNIRSIRTSPGTLTLVGDPRGGTQPLLCNLNFKNIEVAAVRSSQHSFSSRSQAAHEKSSAPLSKSSQ